jgi:hypothetical protein
MRSARGQGPPDPKLVIGIDNFLDMGNDRSLTDYLCRPATNLSKRRVHATALGQLQTVSHATQIARIRSFATEALAGTIKRGYDMDHSGSPEQRAVHACRVSAAELRLVVRVLNT